MSQHKVLTLDGTAQQLSAVLLGAEANKSRSAVWVQPRPSNAGAIYIGTNDDLSNVDYGVYLPPPDGGVPPPPFCIGEFAGGAPERFRSPLKLEDFYVLGTSGEFLHILIVDF